MAQVSGPMPLAEFTSRTQDGKTLLSVQDVPVAEVARLLKALQEGMSAEPTLAAK